AGVDWPTLVDPGGQVAAEYGVDGAPANFFLKPDGTIAGDLIGPSSSGTWRRSSTRSPGRADRPLFLPPEAASRQQGCQHRPADEDRQAGAGDAGPGQGGPEAVGHRGGRQDAGDVLEGQGQL